MQRPDYSGYEQEVQSFFSIKDVETVGCLFCKKSFSTFLFNKHPFMNIIQCNCGLVYNMTPPKLEALNRFYTRCQGFVKTWQAIKKTDFEDKRQREKYGKAVDYILSQDSIKSVLDYGSGSSLFLPMLAQGQKKLDLNAYDPGLKHLDFQNGIRCLGMLDPAEQYDCITAWGVLEHLKDPIADLKNLKRMLKPNGKLIVCVPNVESEVVKLLKEQCFTFCPQHLWYFSTKTLERLLNAAGFQWEHHWTIEDESVPIARFKAGLSPYGSAEGLTLEPTKPEDRYKIVAVAHSL